MISLFIGLLTFALWALCLLLILLILVQLPKKEAGAGLAFGAGAAEAVFGAGAGTPLSKFTRNCSFGFLGVALLLYMLNSSKANESERLLQRLQGLKRLAKPPPWKSLLRLPLHPRPMQPARPNPPARPALLLKFPPKARWIQVLLKRLLSLSSVRRLQAMRVKRS